MMRQVVYGSEYIPKYKGEPMVDSPRDATTRFMEKYGVQVF